MTTPEMPWTLQKFYAFDVETTGVDTETARIVTAAVVKFDNGQPVETRTWLVNPEIPIPPEATAIHGVTNEIADAEGLDPLKALTEIKATLFGQLQSWAKPFPPVVAYNAAYDLTVLWRESLRVHIASPTAKWTRTFPVIDPRVIDKQKDRYRKGKRTLGDVCTHYGVDLGDAHNAGADALAAGQLAIKLAEKYPELTKVDAAYLHERQVAWYAEQAQGLAQHWRNTAVRIAAVDGDGPEPQELMHRAATINTHWPIIPVKDMNA